MTKQTKVVLEYALQEFIFAIDDLRQQGWQFDEQNPPAYYGRSYECHMHRVPTTEQEAKDAAEAAKPSRAEILAKARASKKQKQEAPAEAVETPAESTEAPAEASEDKAE